MYNNISEVFEFKGLLLCGAPMKAYFSGDHFLTNAAACIGIFLTLALLVLAPFRNARADNIYTNPAWPTSISGAPANSPFDDQEKNHRVGLLLDYVRKEAPGWAPGLPHAMRDPGGWLRNGLGLGGTNDSDGDSMSSVFQPMTYLMRPPMPGESEAAWLSPDYHHKGFLPVNDAMIMGANLRHRILDDTLQFDLHPFYGQNWHSSDGYWGTELALNLRSSSGAQPWGKIALRYSNGDQALMDRGRGFDMHSELKFDESLSLNAGIRESENTELGNYVLLRWKLVGGE